MAVRSCGRVGSSILRDGRREVLQKSSLGKNEIPSQEVSNLSIGGVLGCWCIWVYRRNDEWPSVGWDPINPWD